MRDKDTEIGGRGHDFTATAWSVILHRPDASPEERRRQMERLAHRYWKPIYSFIRARWRRTSEESKDLTQKFFLWMLETDFISKVEAGRGRFRNFVKTALERFVMGEYDAQSRQKRGGHVRRINIDFLVHGEDGLPSPEGDPEAVLTDEWRRALLSEALTRLRAASPDEGKTSPVSLFEEYYLVPQPRPTYEELAARHGLKTADVAAALAHARSKYRAILEELVSDGVTGFAELREEFRDLFGERA